MVLVYEAISSRNYQQTYQTTGCRWEKVREASLAPPAAQSPRRERRCSRLATKYFTPSTPRYAVTTAIRMGAVCSAPTRVRNADISTIANGAAASAPKTAVSRQRNARDGLMDDDAGGSADKQRREDGPPHESAALADRVSEPWRSGSRCTGPGPESLQTERLKRNEGVSRLAEKPSRRDLEASRRDLLELDARYRLNSNGKFDKRQDYLHINNTLLTPGEVAERVIKRFDLPRVGGANPT